MQYILDHKAIASLNAKLDITPVGYEQDWELEFSDKTRIDEFIILYCNGKLTMPEKRALLALLISSLDDMFATGNPTREMLNEMATLIRENYTIAFPLLNYWIGEKGDDFHISSFLRQIVKNMG